MPHPPDPTNLSDPTLERSITATGRALFERMAQHSPGSLFSRKGVYHRLMEWSMRDPEFKTALFRFVDVLPTLPDGSDVVRLMKEYLGEKAVALHRSFGAAFRMAEFAPSVAAAVVRWQMRDMAKQFVSGETADDLLRHFRWNERHGIATTVDLLGEAVVSEAEANEFLRRNLEILDALSSALQRDRSPAASSDLAPDRTLPRINLSVKISALAPASTLQPEAPAAAVEAIKARLRPILRRAKEVDAFVNFDMESTSLKATTLALFRSILEEPEFADGPEAGIALQAYLKETERDLSELLGWARKRERRIGIRLVKGAYWDYETTLALQRGWPLPVWQQKAESDACFERLTITLLDNLNLVTPAFASHNVRSIAHAIAQAERRGIDPRAYEFQALYGMADDLKLALLQSGYRVREYCPVGELLPGMAYLVRRLLENTSNEGFLRAKNTGEIELEELLVNPTERILPAHSLPPPRFQNAPNTDFTRPENRAAYDAALTALRGATARRWPLIIGDCEYWGAGLEPSINPAQPDQIVGHWSRATIAEADAAVAAAHAAWPAWAATPVEERAAILEKTAELIEAQRFTLAALETFEAGKPWVEADSDISEAIDFCRFYATEMRRLDAEAMTTTTQRVPGETNRLSYTPRGVGVVIAPWNFPLAILCGLTVAPLVAGNCVIMKPAEQTSLIAAAFMELLTEAGLPPGVANLLTGVGEEIGPHLTSHPKIDFIAFTGSRAVGTAIWQSAGVTAPGQANLKKVVCEMGGKNALIIDTSADLDEAILAALSSAFGFSGQKCSALSRLIVLEEVYERFVPRFIAAASALKIGDPALPDTVIGPVIDAEAQSRILAAIEQGCREATLAWQGEIPTNPTSSTGSGSPGYYVPPTIFTNVAPDSALAQAEIFGPVVAILKAKDLTDAFALANGTEYALTGGLFSRSPATLERAKREFLVGNLYLNRSITGAVVERQPFGGFHMSGGGAKAGGKETLKEFLFPRVISENIMRRGFTPEIME